MNTIVRMNFGSHLYGTSTPSSDVDLKSVFIPPASDILLQRVKGTISSKRPKDAGEKNYAGEVDEEAFSLQRYLQLLVEGQTVALDMLFAPPSAWIVFSDAWREIIANRNRLLTKKSSAFVGYCRQQANKYGIKGSRVAAAKDACSFFSELIAFNNPANKLEDHAAAITLFAETHEHCAIVELEAHNYPGKMLKHFECCGRKVPWTLRLQTAYDLYLRLFTDYGARARMAEANDGIDWKALSHAVRVGYEALELMTTGKITFPLPNREHILEIKLGKLPYKEVAKEIEDLLVTVEATEKTSILPATADLKWIDEFVEDHHLITVLGRGTI